MNAPHHRITPDAPILKLALGTLDLVVIRGVRLRPLADTDDGWLFERVDAPGVTVAYDDAALWLEQAMTGFRHLEGFFDLATSRVRTQAGVNSFDEIPEREKPLVVWKYGWACALRDLIAERDAVASARDGMEGGSRDETHPDLARVSLSDAGLEVAIAIIQGRRKAGEALRKPAGSRGKRSGPGKNEEDELPRVKALCAWHKKLREARWDPIVLRLNYRRCGGRDPKLSDLVEDVMGKHAAGYAHVDQPTQRHQYDLVLTELGEINARLPEAERLAAPSFGAFRDRIKALDPFFVRCRRKGVDVGADEKRIVSQGVGATEPGERVEMDEWNLQLKVILKRAGVWQTLSKRARKEAEQGRLWLCVAIDCATRVVLGASLSRDPSTDSVLACVRMVISDKTAHATLVGARSPWTMAVRPLRIVTDAGSTFVNDRVRDALAGLRIPTATTIAGQAWMRGTIERFFSTVHTSLLSRLPGRTFENPVAKGDYPGDRVGLDVDDLAYVVFRWLVDEYHNRPHAGLGGETPANAWRRLTRKARVRPLPNPDEKRAVFGVDVTKTAGKRGVQLFGLDYQSLSLQAHCRGDVEVKVRVDVEDIGHVSVWLAGAWETVACASDGFDGVSLAEWKSTAGALRARFGREAALSRSNVDQALRDIRARVTKVIEVIGLDDDLPSAAMIKRVEAGLDIGFQMPRRNDGDASPPDLLADIRPASGPRSSADASAAGAVPGTGSDSVPERDRAPHTNGADRTGTGAPTTDRSGDPAPGHRGFKVED